MRLCVSCARCSPGTRRHRAQETLRRVGRHIEAYSDLVVDVATHARALLHRQALVQAAAVEYAVDELGGGQVTQLDAEQAALLQHLRQDLDLACRRQREACPEEAWHSKRLVVSGSAD